MLGHGYRSQTYQEVARERDELRRQLDNKRYEEELESERRYQEHEQKRREQQREREERRRAMMPSNRLYRGEVEDFEEATRLHIAACEQEITVPEPNDDGDMRQTIERCNTSMRELISNATQAARIYHEVMWGVRPAIISKLRDAGLDEWADAYESSDYSSMAI